MEIKLNLKDIENTSTQEERTASGAVFEKLYYICYPPKNKKESMNTICKLLDHIEKLETTINELMGDIEYYKNNNNYLNEEINQRDKIIRILDKGYKHWHMDAKGALDFSKEAKEMTYRNMQILQNTLDDILKGGK